MKFLFNRKKVQINTTDFLTKYDRIRKKLLIYNYHKKIFNYIRKRLEIGKLRLNLEHEDLKAIYSEIQLINTESDEINMKLRGILLYLGTVMLTNDNMLNLRGMTYELMLDVNRMDYKNQEDFVKQLKYKDFLNKILKIIVLYEKLIKLEFNIKNRQIILNNIKL